jgi:hypothetical protein
MIIKNGDLLAWKNDGSWVSHMVAFLTGGKYTHVGIAWCLHNRPYVLDAYWKGGVRLTALSDQLPVDHIPTRIKWNTHLEDYALSKLGRSYHYLGALMLGFDITPNYDADVCSIYAADVLRKGGVDIPSKVPLTPQKLVDLTCVLCDTPTYTITNLKGINYEQIRNNQFRACERIS